MRIAFKNFGCRTNMFETDLLYLEAERQGFEVVSDEEKADAYVINSCTVTAGADRDARNFVYRFKRINPKARVAVIGCYAQVAKDQLLELPGVDFVLGTADKLRILDLLRDSEKRDHVAEPTGFLPKRFLGSRHARANIKVQDGCNYRCSFCTIPLARGRSRSLSPDNVLTQVEAAYQQGFKEIVLTGIHLAHYGWDQGSSLVDLVDRLVRVEGPRIRLSTLDPFEIPEQLIDRMVESSRLCPFFHIALQSGDNDVLKRMKRIYQASSFVEVTRKIVDRVPHAFVGVDVIVGFPGETETAFEKTRVLLESTPWAKLHVFSFSARKGTPAAQMDAKVHSEEIAKRSRVLREMSDKKYHEFLKRGIGSECDLLIERPARGKNYYWIGHTENYVPAEVRLTQGAPKQVVRVALKSIKRSMVSAELVT